MGTITCNVNSNRTLTITAVSGPSPSTTWARFQGAFFEVSGGGSFDLALTVPSASFRFHTTEPIEWGPSGQPDWITIPNSPTPQALTLRINSSAVGSSVFTVTNATPGGHSITFTVRSLGNGTGTGGTINAYVGDDQTALIGQLPPGAVAGGRNVTFGFKDLGENALFVSPAATVVIYGVIWNSSQPSHIALEQTATQITFAIDNPSSSETLASEFTLYTNGGLVDPTIITNPDESGP